MYYSFFPPNQRTSPDTFFPNLKIFGHHVPKLKDMLKARKKKIIFAESNTESFGTLTLKLLYYYYYFISFT